MQFLQADADRYGGRCLGIDQINQISNELTNDLIAHGYVTTRVRVPQQNIKSGTLQFQVTPGIIHDIHFAKPTHTTWADAYPTRPGDVLNERDLEQGLEQMQRVPSQDVHVAIAPAAGAGQSDLVIDVKQKKPWRVAFDVNDGGSAQTGSIQGSATFELDNPLHANDMFHAALNSNVKGGVAGGARGDSFYYSVPQGYWTLEASASRFSYSQTIAGLYTPYTLSGTSNSAGFSAQRMLYRSQRVKTSLTFSVTNTASRSFLDDVEIDVQRRNESYGELQLERSWSDGRSALDVSAGLRLGMPILGAAADLQMPDAPTSFYTMEVLDVTATQPFDRGKIAWQPHLSAQLTNDVLYPNDQFSIGNRYTVRGFDGSAALAAESGYYLRNDFVFAGPPAHQFYFGLDTGAVWGFSQRFLSGNSLTGAVIGVRGHYKSASYDVFSGVALHAPQSMDNTAQPAGGFDLQFQL